MSTSKFFNAPSRICLALMVLTLNPCDSGRQSSTCLMPALVTPASEKTATRICCGAAKSPAAAVIATAWERQNTKQRLQWAVTSGLLSIVAADSELLLDRYLRRLQVSPQMAAMA